MVKQIGISRNSPHSMLFGPVTAQLREREQSFGPLSLSLSLSLLRDDTSIRCEEQLIKH